MAYGLGVVVETIGIKVEHGKFVVQPTKRLKSRRCGNWRSNQKHTVCLKGGGGSPGVETRTGRTTSVVRTVLR